MFIGNTAPIVFGDGKKIKNSNQCNPINTNKISFKSEHDTFEFKKAETEIENEIENILMNKEIHEAKIKASFFSAVLSSTCLVGFLIPLYFLSTKAEDFCNPNAENQEKELEKQQKIRKANIEGGILGAIPFLGLLAPLMYILAEDPKNPKYMLFKD